MKTVFLTTNPLDSASREEHQVEDVREFLMERFASWPETARIYHRQVAQSCDVTPTDEVGVALLGSLPGPFHVVVYPQGAVALGIIAIALTVAGTAAPFLLRPSVPNPAARNAQATSPNNELSDRQNQARVNGRIPDIFGTVRSTPDLLSVPYKFFKAHQEVEFLCGCIGRGDYEVQDVRDGATAITDIAGATVEVYGPNESPRNGATPRRFGSDPITVPLASVKRYDSVNGQVLRAPNATSFVGKDNVQFFAPNEIRLPSTDADHDFTKKFNAGDTLAIAGALYGPMATRSVQVDSRGYLYFVYGLPVDPEGAPARYSPGQPFQLQNARFSIFDPSGGEYGSMVEIDLSGNYVIESLNEQYIKLVNPAAVNDAWNKIPNQLAEDGVTTVYTLLGPQDMSVSDGPPLLDLDGSYDILAVSAGVIVLSNPVVVNADWNKVIAWGASPAGMSPTLSVSGPRWIGPFTLDLATTDRVVANFVAQSGLYKDDGKNQDAVNVQVQLEVTPVDADGNPIGPAEYFPPNTDLADPDEHHATGGGVIEGSAAVRTTRALTLEARPTFTGPCQVRARRVTNADLEFKGTVVDEVKWRDVYASADVTAPHFGNVTTVYAVTYATTGALAVKERRLNMLVTRKIPTRVGETTTFAGLTATNRADEILAAICLDPHIGGRSVGELDLDSIYGAVAELEEYFGTSKVTEFNYTFDNDNLSFEETVASLASAIFCQAYRRGNQIKLSFEKSTPDSTLLFNHRNKLPGTEVRTVSFGNQDDVDGIEYEYVDPEDDAVVTYHLPVDEAGQPTATNPKKIQSIGIRSKLQAHFQAHRAWNKIQHQRVATEFDAWQEAELLVIQNRILNADNTRTGTQDGYVKAQDGLALALSQPVKFEAGKAYTVFLQLPDGTVEPIAVTAGAGPRQVVLGTAPAVPLVLDQDACDPTRYVITANDSPREQAFLVTEREAKGNLTSTVRAVNYDDRYYANDRDYLDGIVDEDGAPL